MDTTQQHHHHHHRQHKDSRNDNLPPSPPPSPPTARRRHKKKRSDDPFLTLDPASVQLLAPSPPSSPTRQPDEPQENILIRLLWTPLLVISFLISLFLVNLSDRWRRTKTKPATLLGRLDPEPYQDEVDLTWDRRGSTTHVSPHKAISPRTPQEQPQKRRSWHLHRKIRKVARLEVSDAFEMRERVLVALVLMLLGGGYVGWMGVSWVIRRVWS